MEARYRKLAAVGVRNIAQFNTLLADEPGRTMDDERGGEPVPLQHLPYIVIVIDEMADLMMVSSADVEESIMRLAQMARAVGIHLILATQRPSVDVITGTIKANFPSRIAFRVSPARGLTDDHRPAGRGAAARARRHAVPAHRLGPRPAAARRVHHGARDPPHHGVPQEDRGQAGLRSSRSSKTRTRPEPARLDEARDEMFFEAVRTVVTRKGSARSR